MLYRTNSQSRALEEAFRRAGIPYRLIGAISFYDRREVKDLLAYLRLIANPADDEAFLRAVAVPRRGLGETSLAILGRQAAQWEKSLLETARVADRFRISGPTCARRSGTSPPSSTGFGNGPARLPPAEMLEEIIRGIDYEAMLLAEGPEGADRWENVRELHRQRRGLVGGGDRGAEGGTPLERFLAEAALLTSADTVVGNESGVTLMTLHTAKGLEWPVVVLTGLEDGLFPLARAEEQPDGLEEERRLCYVGLTRAKDKLYLTWARARRRGGELRPGIPSRFLRAIPPGIVEERRTTSLWAPDWGAAAGRRDRARRMGVGDYGERWVWRRAVPPTRRPAGRRALPGRPALRQGRAGPPSPLRRRHDPGADRHGTDLKVSVAFDDEEVGVKQLLVAYAGLEREWESA